MLYILHIHLDIEVNSDYDYATLDFKCFNKYHNSNATDGHGDDGDEGHSHEDYPNPNTQHAHPTEGG